MEKISVNFLRGLLFMLYIGIDVASTKHDCCIIDGDGTVLNCNFTFDNSREGFDFFYDTVISYLPIS